MKEKWFVQNNSGSILSLPQNKVILRSSNAGIDLVAHTGKTVAILENDPEVSANFDCGNIITIEKIKKEPEIRNLDYLKSKLDDVFALLQGTSLEPRIVESAPIDMESLKKHIDDAVGRQRTVIIRGGEEIKAGESSEEEKMREDALKRLIDASGGPSESQLDNFGNKKTEVEFDDNADLIDF